MEKEFPGPYCEDLGLSHEKLLDINSISEVGSDIKIKNGLVLELQTHFSSLTVVDVLKKLKPVAFDESKKSALTCKMARLKENKKKISLKKRKKVTGSSSVNDFLDQIFEPPILKEEMKPPVLTDCESQNKSVKAENSSKTIAAFEMINSATQTVPEEINEAFGSPKSGEKELNLLEYNISKKQLHVKRLSQQIELQQTKVENLKTRIGYYSVKSVNRREEYARMLKQKLSRTQSDFRILRHRKKHVHSKLGSLRNKNQELIVENQNITAENQRLKEKLKAKEVSEKKLQSEIKRKVSAQKASSYFKNASKEIRKSIKMDQQKNLVKEKDAEIEALRNNLEILQEEMKDKYSTRNEDGSFVNNMRLCVIELAGLEVAAEKVTPVIQTVSKHLFDHEFDIKELPTRTSVQSMIDEGHFLAKTFISNQIESTQSWGLSRDGTTRKKKKIVDTSVTLDSGGIISLGFTYVAHETAKVINEVTKNHLTELADLHEKCKLPENHQLTPKRHPMNEENETVTTPKRSISNDFIVTSLNKLAYTMSDRASNEKLADKLLDNWRNEILENCNDEQTKSVQHFHCMAHVLLGFHKYVCTDLKSYEETLSKENGPLGRDALPVFKFWSKKGTVAERVVRTTADTFGPAGDHHGLRDRWEAYCSNKGVKSVIGNYRDNRFNALFQTAAEILVHHSDILEGLDNQKAFILGP